MFSALNKDFDNAFKTVIGHEGGYVNDPNDRGGETKYGISKRAYPMLDIKNLTLKQAKAIYKRDYWDKCGAEYMKTPDLKTLLFDIAVNHGNRRAKMMLQEALNLLNKNGTIYKDLEVDGIIGRKTKEAIRLIKPHYLSMALIAKRIEFFNKISDGSTNENFYAGWLNRAFSFA